MTSNVIDMMDSKAIACGDSPHMIDWLRSWIKWLEKQDDIKSLILVVELPNGRVFKIAQSTAKMDGPRLLGVLDLLRHQILIGKGDPIN